jgi:hypothetical protein
MSLRGGTKRKKEWDVGRISTFSYCSLNFLLLCHIPSQDNQKKKNVRKEEKTIIVLRKKVEES